MFLAPGYILANELVNKMGIHIANVSIMRKEFEDADDLYTIRKLNNCNFVNTSSPKLPQNIKDGISNNTFTDYTNKLPCTFVRDEYPVTEREWMASGIVIGKEEIAGKNFYVFADDFVKKLTGKIGYVLSGDEYRSLLVENKIQGGIRLKRDKYFTWYSV